MHIDPSTKEQFHYRLPVPASMTASSKTQSRGGASAQDPFVLIATGVRTVSFLRIQVYVAALYVEETAWQHFHRDHRRGPNGDEPATVEAYVHKMIQAEVPIVLRIVPVRNTDFAHLRDGFTRAVQSRLKLIQKQQKGGNPSVTINPDQEEAFAQSLQLFKECFPKASLKKGSTLDLVITPASHGSGQAGATDLALEHGGEIYGTVRYQPRTGPLDVGRLLMQAYVADKDPVSEAFKKAATEALLKQ
ncbi:unnamed protein product [Jaminaea pallidilutea]